MCEQRFRAAGRAPSDPLVPAGPEIVDLQCLIQMLTKHFGCVFGEGIWGAPLNFYFAGLFGLVSLGL